MHQKLTHFKSKLNRSSVGLWSVAMFAAKIAAKTEMSKISRMNKKVKYIESVVIK